MSAYTTGHKSCVNAMGIYCARNKSGLAHPKVETIAELVKRHNGGMAVGVVTNTEIEDATPAAMVAHVRRRGDYDEIVRMFHEAKPDVMMGGGSGVLPAEVGQGRQAQGRGELPREVQGARLPVRRHGNGDEGGRRRQVDHAPARSVPSRQSRRRARSASAQEGDRSELSRSARSRRSDAGRDRHPLQETERLRADGGIRV